MALPQKEPWTRIGVDAGSVGRIELAVKRSGAGFLNKVYTPAELAYCGANSERLAGRWAAKEAVIKCFDGTGICFPRRRIEVLPGPNGAPRVRLLGRSEEHTSELQSHLNLVCRLLL